MKKIFVILYILAAAGFAFSQQSTPTPASLPEDDVIKITTSLVQVDVTVTGKDGRPIDNLSADDFEIYENGKRRQVSNISYVSSKPAASQSSAANGLPAVKTGSEKRAAAQPIAPPVKVRPGIAGRFYSLVVDDLGLSYESIDSVKNGLKKFIDQQMQPDDLVSVIRTSAGSGALQQFTSDKRILYAAIQKLSWYAGGRGEVSAFRDAGVGGADPIRGQRDEFYTAGTFGALRYVVRGMQPLPGRKSIILFADGLPFFRREDDGRGGAKNASVSPVLRNLINQVTDLANRSSVIIYTVDSRGLQLTMPEAGDDVSTGIGGKFSMGGTVSAAQLAKQRQDELMTSQQSLSYLAEETGGFGVTNLSDLGKAVGRIFSEQKNYYLVAYQPDDATFDPKNSRFNQLTVKVKRPDAKVRYHSGFFANSDKKTETVSQTPTQQIVAALTSPINAGDIDLSLNTILTSDEKNTAIIRSVIHIDVKDLVFTEEADGKRKANIDVIAVTFGETGAPVEQFAKNYDISLAADTYRDVLEKGFVYDLPVPVRKPGIYQFRIAVRDSKSAKIGSASNLIQVPNLSKDFTVSGIILDSVGRGQKSPAQNSGGDTSDSYIDTSLRKFKPLTGLRYGYLIYNPRVGADHKPQVQIQTRLLSQGKVVYESSPVPLRLDGQADMAHLENIGMLTLGKNLVPGDYVLQVVVRDMLADAKKQVTSQWIDFEIVE